MRKPASEVVEAVVGGLHAPYVALHNAAHATFQLGAVSYDDLDERLLDIPTDRLNPDRFQEGIFARFSHVKRSADELAALRLMLAESHGFALPELLSAEEQQRRGFPLAHEISGIELDRAGWDFTARLATLSDDEHLGAFSRFVEPLLPYVSVSTVFGADREIDRCHRELAAYAQQCDASPGVHAALYQLPRIMPPVYNTYTENLGSLVNQVLEVACMPGSEHRWPESSHHGPPRGTQPVTTPTPAPDRPRRPAMRSAARQPRPPTGQTIAGRPGQRFSGTR